MKTLAPIEVQCRELLEAAPDGMVVVNHDGEIVLLNLQAERQFGYSRDELVGQQVKRIIPEGFAERLIADGARSAAEALSQQIGNGLVLSGRRRDGSEFPVELMLSPLESADGILVTAAIRDISMRRAAEQHLAQMEGKSRLVEYALRESEERYRVLLDGIRDYAIFMMDPQGRVISWNAGAERIKGYRADEIVGENFACFFIPEDIRRGRPANVLRLAAQNGRHQEEAVRVRKDGSRFLASLTFTALRDPAGNLLGFSEFSHDLSESKEFGAKYRGLLEAAPDAMVVVNQGGEIVLLNLQAEKQFGYSRDELVGQQVRNIIPEGFAERLIADGTRSASEALAQHIGMGIELSGQRRDGSEFPIELMLSPLESAEGILVTAAIRDISVRKAAEKRLAQMESRYRGLLEAAPDAMVVVNQGGEIVLVNVQAEKKFGYGRNELVGQQVTNIIPEGFAERLIADGTRSAAEALAQHIGMGIELSARRRDGSYFPIELMLSPLESATGILVTAAIRDISVRKAAEKRLAQMESRYRALLEAAPDAMVVVNQRGEIVLLNVQAEKQFGYSRDELLGQQVTNIIPEGFVERLIADGTRSGAEALAQHIGMGIELSGRRKDGSHFPIELMLSPLESATGILVTAAIRDISERRRAQEELRQSEELLRLTVSSVKDYAIFMLDPQGRIATWNEGAERMNGYGAVEIVGRHFSCFYATDDVKSGKPDFELEEAVRNGHVEESGFRIRKDGSKYLADVVITALHDQEGRLRGFGQVIHDITKREEAQNNLAQMTRELTLKHQLLDSVVEGTSDPIYVRDLDGRFLLANSACVRLFGSTVNHVLGRTMRELLPNDSYYAVAQSDREVVLDGKTRTVEEVADIDGISRIFLTTKGPYRDADQKTIGTMGVARDITERKRSEERLLNTARELRRSNEELQQFAYVASHDLQEPLRMVASYTDLLKKRYRGRLDSDADEFIDFALDGCKRMQGLIRDLLAYSHVGTSGKAIQKCHSEDALNSALVNLRAIVEESGAVVTHDPLPVILSNDKQLTQVFQNLVGNAIKYRSAEVPHIHISATKNQRNEWVFSVRDNGVGIDSQYFERIFILFQRLHGQTEFEGTGIGLAICRKIVARLGGRIWVESESGKGSTFYFALPDTRQAADTGAQREREAGDLAAGQDTVGREFPGSEEKR